MKICFTVAEYNPFHNGHKKHLDYIRNELKPDYVVVVMSGDFTQRGEIAITDKYARAVHAVTAGADAVIELPTVFATANAEIFAKGAIKLMNYVKGEHCICFGSESAEKKKLVATAKAIIAADENKEYAKLVKEEAKAGVPVVQAKCAALKRLGSESIDFGLFSGANNALALEYTKAIIQSRSKLEVFPIIREGADYNDDTLYKNFSSATAIRKAIKEGKLKKIKSNVPDFVYKDLKGVYPDVDDFIFYSALKSSRAELKSVADCTEGLENRIKALMRDCDSLECLKSKLKTKRYPYTRLSRILLSNMLGISEAFTKKCLSSELYLKVLAAKKGSKILSDLQTLSYAPLITRKSDLEKLSGVANECFRKDVYALEVFDYATKRKTNEYEMKLV